MNAPKIRRQKNISTAFIVLAATACCTAMLSLSGCGGSSDAVDPVAPRSYARQCHLAPGSSNALVLPEPTGSQCIGKTSLRLVDEARLEGNSLDKSDRRELSVKVWYPIAATAGGVRAEYLESAIAPLLKSQLSLPSAAPDVLTNARSGLPLQPGSVYPVVIFSPGYGMVVETYSTLLEDLASHGIVVVAIDHPYVSGATSMADGRLVLALPEPAEVHQVPAFLDQALATLVADQRYVLDWLQTRNIGMLAGHLDVGQIGVVGHSIGGAAAIHTSRSDVRVKASVNMDGTVPGDISGPWPTPLMFLLSATHLGDDTVDSVLRHATGSSRSVTVQGAGHLDFSDLKWLVRFYLPSQSAGDLEMRGLGIIDASKALQAVRQETFSFLQQFVR